MPMMMIYSRMLGFGNDDIQVKDLKKIEDWIK